MKKNKKSPLYILLAIIVIVILIKAQYGGRQDLPSTIGQSDPRNFYGISWRGTACDNLAYAKAMGYDAVLYQNGMNNCPSSDKANMSFYINQPEDVYGGTFSGTINVEGKYTQSQINRINQVMTWKGNGTDLPFPYNLATGWWFTNITFRALVDYQQQKIIDDTVAYSINRVGTFEDTSINWRFAGWAWDVPDLKGDWWTERQAGYTGTSWMCGNRSCAGKIVTLAYWNSDHIESGAIHGNITHEYATYPDGRAAMMVKLFTETRNQFPNMYLIYEPYHLYDWIKVVDPRADRLGLMPPDRVLLSQESGDNPTNDLEFLTDSRVYASGLIAKDHVMWSSPDNHNISRNIVIAGNAAVNGAWMGYYGRFGGTDGTPNYQTIRDVPYPLRMIRVIPNWDNMNAIPLAERTWDATNKIYSSPSTYVSQSVMYSKHPKNGNLYVVVLNKDTGVINLPSGQTIKEIYSTDALFKQSLRADSDFAVTSTTATLISSSNQEKGYVFILEGAEQQPQRPTDLCILQARTCTLSELENTKTTMLNYLENVNGTIYGHHIKFDSSLVVSLSQPLSIQSKTGRYPGILAIDYYDLTQRRAYTDHTNDAIITHWEDGGLSMISIHMINPQTWPTNNGTWTSGTVRDKRIDLSTIINDTIFNEELETIAAGIKELQDRGVIVMFRPFHEMNGGWFWWGNKDPALFKAMWRYVHDFMENKGLKNIIWVYSPNANSGNYLTFYPGDDYVDVVSLDYYGTNLAGINGYSDLLTTGKPFGISEFGQYNPSSTPTTDYDSTITLNAIKNNLPESKFILSYLGSWSFDNQLNINTFLNDYQMIDLSMMTPCCTGSVCNNNLMCTATIYTQQTNTTNTTNTTSSNTGGGGGGGGGGTSTNTSSNTSSSSQEQTSSEEDLSSIIIIIGIAILIYWLSTKKKRGKKNARKR